MKRFLVIAAAVVLAAFGSVIVLGASPPAQDDSKDKVIKSLTERIDKLEKRVAELEKKLAQKPSGGIEKFLEKFGGGDWDGLKKKLDEFRDGMPEMPDFQGMPDLFQGMDMDQLLEMLKGQFEGQLPGFFDGLDLEGLFDKFKHDAPKSEPKKKEPKRRSI